MSDQIMLDAWWMLGGWMDGQQTKSLDVLPPGCLPLLHLSFDVP
jgi:hypothetical protein